jgi:hypothetical protein
MSYLYQMLIDYTCMLRIGYKHMILITFNLAKPCLKVNKVNYYRLISSYHLKSLRVYKFDHSIMLGQSC